VLGLAIDAAAKPATATRRSETLPSVAISAGERALRDMGGGTLRGENYLTFALWIESHRHKVG
jgi:hypothetical protein